MRSEDLGSVLGVIVDELTEVGPVGKLYRIHKLGILSTPQSAKTAPKTRKKKTTNLPIRQIQPFLVL